MTAGALDGDGPAARQFSIGLDDWMVRLDSVLTRDSNGHHGVSVGDADGDGREDLYVAQPSGLPNRLLRARGDGTFEDATDGSGLGLLDDTAQSLFADIDNDGDQDLVLATSSAAAAARQRRARPLLDRGQGVYVRLAAAGRADRGDDGRLRPRRIPRRVPVRLLLLLRRR